MTEIPEHLLRRARFEEEKAVKEASKTEERAASYKELLQTAIAHDEMSENWRIFQQELSQFIYEECDDMGFMSGQPDLIEKYPNLTAWMRQYATAEAERALRQAVLDEIAAKLSELDDVTLAEMGFKRV
jgi:hypothetical protein